MVKYFEKYDAKTCYGCRACEQICPQNAIHMEPDKEGFLYPALDAEKCTFCGLCKKICPYTNNMLPKALEADVYAVKYRKREAFIKSSSGGAFSAMADYVLGMGGNVVGCVFDETFIPIHIIANNSESLAPMRGSKYIQSDTRETYTQVRKLLNKDRWVLYTGTPCEIAGLRSFLCKDYDKLITVDLICHGVPSPGLFRKYLDSMEKSQSGKIVEFRFRDKEKNGWTSRGTVTFEKKGRKKIKRISPYDDSFYNLYYLQNAINRMCCYSCQYAQEKRVGDITIGDFWNISEVVSSFDDSEGVSLMLVNTAKGKMIFESLAEKVDFALVDINAAAAGNGNLRQPTGLPTSRAEIYKCVNSKGYDLAAKTYCKYRYVIPTIKRIIPNSVKKLIKSVLHRKLQKRHA